MVIPAAAVCILFAMFIIIRQVRTGHDLEARISRNSLIDEAENKYPCMSLPDSLDMLYREYGDRLTIARTKGFDVTEIIKRRQIIAHERAQKIVKESHSQIGFEVIHSAQA